MTAAQQRLAAYRALAKLKIALLDSKTPHRREIAEEIISFCHLLTNKYDIK